VKGPLAGVIMWDKEDKQSISVMLRLANNDIDAQDTANKESLKILIS
jgi:hypothetical protein